MDSDMGLGTIARANIRRHPGRAALMALGMALAVAAFITVVSLVLSLRGTMDDKLARYGASLLVMPASAELSLEYGGMTVADVGSGEVPALDDDAVARILGIPSKRMLAEAVPVLVQPVSVVGSTYLALGTDLEAMLRAKPWWKIEGTAPDGPGQVLLGLEARNRLASDPGATLDIQGRDYTVSGVLWETGGDEDGVIVMDRQELAQLTGRGAEVSLVEIVAADSGAAGALSEEISKALPDASVVSIKKSLEFNSRADVALGRFGLAATALIVVVSGAIISLTMLASVRERRREIGILRAIGYRCRDIWVLLLLESIFLSGGAALVGTALGLAGAALGPRLVQSLELEFVVNPVVVVTGVVLSAVLAVSATLYPASRAARLDPASALRGV